MCKEQTLLLQLLLFIPSLPGGQDLREAPQNQGGERPQLWVAPRPFGPALRVRHPCWVKVAAYSLGIKRARCLPQVGLKARGAGCGLHFVMGPVRLGMLLSFLTVYVPASPGTPKEDDDIERFPSKCEGI